MEIFDDLQFLEHSPDAVIVTTPEGKVTYWSPGARRIFGYDAQDAVGSHLHELLVPGDRVDEERKLASSIIEYGTTTYESLRQHKDGSSRYVTVSGKAIRDDESRLRYLLYIKKDVTYLKGRRDARMVGARYGDLLETMPDGIVIVNPAGHVVLANAQIGLMFGYEPSELQGVPVERLMPERFRSQHVRFRGDYARQPRTRAMGAGLELFGLRRDGSEFPVEISLSPLEIEESVFVSAAIRDITDRKRVEAALQRKNQELAAAMESRDRFLANMSHELRTPLNAIIGFTGTLLMELAGPLTPDQDKQLKTVQNSARHLHSLINDLLDLAKIDAGMMDIHPESLDAGEVVRQVVQTLEPQADDKNLDVSVDIGGSGSQMRTDRRILSQILLNLLGNAIKFTDSGSVTVALSSDEQGGGQIRRFTVTDTGPGIRPEDQARLFEPFARFQESGRERKPGTGLGLHLSRKLAEALGGSIVFDSTPGQGSRFTLSLRA